MKVHAGYVATDGDKVLQATSKTDSGYVLEATGKGGIAPGESKGTIAIVREGGKLKLDRESWKQVAGGA